MMSRTVALVLLSGLAFAGCRAEYGGSKFGGDGYEFAPMDIEEFEPAQQEDSPEETSNSGDG